MNVGGGEGTQMEGWDTDGANGTWKTPWYWVEKQLQHRGVAV